VFDKMAAIKPATTVSCLDNRRLDVRYNGKRRRYEFREQGGRCGNFAIVEVTSTDKDWVTRIEGGHSAMVRVTPDGLGLRTLKLYTLTGSTVDTWLDSVMQGQEFSQRKLIHGLFTYDFFAIIQTVRTGQGQWLRPKAWTQVQSPLAFVVYGETQTIPWEEE
jgi:hypothetical protein